ncbi:MAG: response regulator, partial [Alphaproteobacteria bacterium]
MTGAQTVLFVDDEPLVARLYARAAASLGLETRFAEDGGLALAQIAASPPDIIVSDWLMPGMSGLELAEALVRKQLKTMPLILLSAREGGATLQSGLAHGADDFLLKGVSFETVIARLRFWMQAPLPGLPPDARARARAGLAHYRPGHDPVLLLQMPRDLLI